MRIGSIVVGLLLPLAGQAQLFKRFEVGTYVLASSPAVVQQGGLYLRSGDQLVVRNVAGSTAVLEPAQVRSFRVAGQRYVPTGGFLVRDGLGDTYVKQGFAQQLDSGQVQLLRYESAVGNVPTPMSGNLVYGSGATTTVYLLQRAGQPAVTPVQTTWKRTNPRLASALAPYLGARPDLQQLLAAHQLEPAQLPQLVRALNSGQPYEAAAAPR